jgi:hypothetical protein
MLAQVHVAVALDINPGFMNGLWVKSTGRSWWEAEYTDGRRVSEWQTLKDIGDPKSSRWEDVDRKNLRTLVLLTPDRNAYGLRATEDNKLFQFKAGVFHIGQGTVPDAHIIGVITNTAGDCACFAWEPQNRRTVKFEDNVLNMKYRSIGALGLDNLRLKF